MTYDITAIINAAALVSHIIVVAALGWRLLWRPPEQLTRNWMLTTLTLLMLAIMSSPR